MVTHKPVTLVPIHRPETAVMLVNPVPVGAATLYVISKRPPVVGGVERPERLTAPTSTTPGPSPDARLQPVPAPLTQLAKIRTGCASRVLEMSALIGLRTELSVLMKIRNPFNASEPSMLIAKIRWERACCTLTEI